MIPAFLAFLFSISTTGALPRPQLDPLFDGTSAGTFADTLAAQYPSRVPGSEGAAESAVWYRETVASLGLQTEEDVWTADVADLGEVELRNIVSVVPGRSDQTIVVVAHRDNAGPEESLGENATGTALLIELARGFAAQEGGPDPLPEHTLALVSTDAGAFGGAGAAHFVAESPLAADALAIVVLDLGPGRPRLAIAGDEPVSPARTLVRTASARFTEELGVAPALPSIPTQFLNLGVPFALDEQGRFLAAGLSAVTVATEREDGGQARPDDERLGQLGRATEALVSSLDTSVGGAFRTPDSLFFSDRAASGWTARLALILAVVPFALGVVDLIVRGRRRGLPFAPAMRAQGARLGIWAFGAVLVWIGALAQILPTGEALPLAPYTDFLETRPVFGLFVLSAAFVLGWLVVRRPIVAVTTAAPAERLAGFVVALTLLGLVAIGLALFRPYALVFVLPSLYAWLWLPLEARLAVRIGLLVAGLAGPAVGLVLLGRELGLSVPDAALYVAGLFTVGYLPLGAAVLGIAWIAAATQIVALAFGRYAPYAGGVERPPAGRARRSFVRLR
ncbi:MAG TPA: M28 family peptidase [Gaiellaceae bacterium]|nr:M28 family peptidase [Gaiellaceae bacterium]